MSKYLIINADDFGMCSSYNEAVFRLLEEGKITSSTLMPVTPKRDEAAEWCKAHQVKCVGLHTTFTSEWASYKWGSLTGRSSLEDGNGHFYSNCREFWQSAKREDVAAELAAQFAWFASSGVFFSHADNHMGSVYPLGGVDYLPLVYEQCAKYGLGFRMFRNFYWNEGTIMPAALVQEDIDLAGKMGVTLLDTLYGFPFNEPYTRSYEETKAAVCEMIRSMPEGVNEMYFHPSVDSEEVRKITPTWQRRIWDYQLLRDSEVEETIKKAGLIKISYRDIERVRG